MTHKHRRKNGVTFACDCDDGERLAAECKALSDQCQDVRAQRDKAQSELSAARADAERYRWLRNRIGTYEGDYVAGFSGDELDAELDKARVASSAGPALSGMQVVIDPTMPEGTAELRCGDSRVPIVPSAGGPQSGDYVTYEGGWVFGEGRDAIP